MKLRERIALALLPPAKRSLFLQSATPEEFFGGGRRTMADAVNPKLAVTATAVWSAVNLLASQVAKLPLKIYRTAENGSRVQAKEHHLYRVLHDEPNPAMSSYTLRQTMMLWMLLRGNSVSLVQRDVMGRPRHLWPVEYDRVTMRVTTRGDREFRIDGELVRRSSILFVPGLSWDGYEGISVISALRNSTGLLLAAEQYGSTFFERGGDIKGYLKYAGFFKDQAARDRVISEWEQRYATGAKSGHRTPLLENGMDYHKVTPTPEDAQFIETRKFQVTEVARVFRVPPHMIYDLERSTFSNIEHQGREFLQYSLDHWLVQIQSEMTRQLLSEEERELYYIEFDTNALLRPTQKERYEAYRNGRMAGFLSVNEIRAWENLPNIGPHGDRYLEPLNMAAAGKEGENEIEA